MHHPRENTRPVAAKSRSPRPSISPYCIDEITLTRSEIMKARDGGHS